jgi:thiamine pyrophosphokinase
MGRGWQTEDSLLCVDRTLLRLFPPLRATWALPGYLGGRADHGANAKRLLFGPIDLRTARRVMMMRRQAGQADA